MTRSPLRWLAATLVLTAAPLGAQEVVQPLPGTTAADKLAETMKRVGANPTDLSALLTAGEQSLALGDLSGAASLFARADKIDPRSGRVKAGMGSILVRSERPGEALQFFRQAEQLGQPVSAFAADRGLAYDLVGDQVRAQTDYRLALRTTPDDETVRRYALSLGISGDQKGALAQLDPLLRKTDRGAWRSRAFILAMGGNVTEASKIAKTMMPGQMASGLTPFFARLPALSPADRAFAVHFGEVTTTPERIADAKLAPNQPALAAQSAPVQVAAVRTQPAVPPAVVSRPATATRAPVQLAQATPTPTPVRSTAPSAVAASGGPTLAPPVTRRPSTPAQVASVPAQGVATPVQPTRTPTSTAVAPTQAVRPPVQIASTRPVVAAPVAARPATAGVQPLPTVTSSAPAATTAAPAVQLAAVSSAPPLPPSAAPSSTILPATGAIAQRTSVPASSVTAAGTPPQTRVVAARAPISRASGDAILAKIIAGLTIPASELEVRAPTPSRNEGSRVVAEAKAKTARDTVALRAADRIAAAETADAVKSTSSHRRSAAVEVADASTTAKGAGRKTASGRRGKAADDAATAEVDAEKDATDTGASSRKGRRGSKQDADEATDKRASTDRKTDSKKALPAKQDAEDKKAAKANPQRIWVQVAGGANEDDLPKAWAAAQKKSPELAKRKGYSTPLRATNRVLTGPFKSDEEAQAFVNQLKKSGLSGFQFTSDKGQKVTPLSKK